MKRLFLLAILLATPATAQHHVAVAVHYQEDSGAFIWGYASRELTMDDAIDAAVRMCIREGGKPDDRDPGTLGYGKGDSRQMCSVWPWDGASWYDGGDGSLIPMLEYDTCIGWRKDTSPQGEVSYTWGYAPTRVWLEGVLRIYAEQDPDIADWEIVMLICSHEWAPSTD